MLLRRYFYLLLVVAIFIGACQPPVVPPAAAPVAPAAAKPTAAPAEPTAPPAEEAASQVELPDVGTLQVAFVPVLASAPFFVAADMGFFAEQGLTVELLNVRNVDEMLAPLSTGKLDATSMVVTTGFFNAMSQKLDFRLVVGAGDPNVPPEPAPFLVVGKALVDSGAVAGVADLKGRKIAINLRGSGLEYLLHKGLEKSGLTLDDVEMVTIPGSEMMVAVQNGAVDGAVAGILNVQRMIGEGVAVPLLNNVDAVSTGDAAGGLVFGQRLLQPENREVGIRFIVAYLQALRFLNDGGWENPDVVALLQKYTGMEPPMIARSPKIVFTEDGVLDVAGIQDVEAFQLNRGYVEYTEPIPAEQMADLSMLAEALARLDQ